MNTTYSEKSSIDEIRERFDNDVDRFSNLDTGQQTIIDAPLSLELITSAAQHVNAGSASMLDIGCGAGNFTLKMLQKMPALNCTLVDLSRPMLKRAGERVAEATTGKVETIQADILELDLPKAHFDIVVAASVLHHLREDSDWEKVFTNIFNSLKPGGSFWISDLIIHDSPALNAMFTEKYAQYLEGLGGAGYRQKVFDYIEKEDTPRSLNFQLDLMKKVGFHFTEVLHKNSCFAAFGAIK